MATRSKADEPAAALVPAGPLKAAPIDVDFRGKAAESGLGQLDNRATVGRRPFVEKADSAARNVLANDDRGLAFDRLAIGIQRREAKQDWNGNAIVMATLALNRWMQPADESFDLTGECGSRASGLDGEF